MRNPVLQPTTKGETMQLNLIAENCKRAVVSDCDRYRYSLSRSVDGSGVVFAYFGINPSTADAMVDDATVRKWRGFALRNGGKYFVVGNVFAFRATDVRELASAEDPVGPDNETYLRGIIDEADVLVPCWGNVSKVPRSLRHHIGTLAMALVMSGKPIKCFGRTKSGDPKHPLMLGYDTRLIDF